MDANPTPEQSALERTDSIIVKAVRTMSYISGACLIIIMLLLFFNMLGEKLPFLSGIPLTKDIVQYLHIPMVYLAMAYVTLDRGHIRIDLLSTHFPKALQVFFGTLANLLGAGISGFISYRGFEQMLKFISRHKMSAASGRAFPLWPFALILVIGFALLAFSFIWNIVRSYALPNAATSPPIPGAEPENAEGGTQ